MQYNQRDCHLIPLEGRKNRYVCDINHTHLFPRCFILLWTDLKRKMESNFAQLMKEKRYPYIYDPLLFFQWSSVSLKSQITRLLKVLVPNNFLNLTKSFKSFVTVSNQWMTTLLVFFTFLDFALGLRLLTCHLLIIPPQMSNISTIQSANGSEDHYMT